MVSVRESANVGRPYVQSTTSWSAATNVNNPSNARNVHVNHGTVHTTKKIYSHQVWCVRGKQNAPLYCLRICAAVSALPTVEVAHIQHALRFDMKPEENPARFLEELEGSTDHPSRSVCFVVKQPRFQEIIAADLRDRVVHHV